MTSELRSAGRRVAGSPGAQSPGSSALGEYEMSPLAGTPEGVGAEVAPGEPSDEPMVGDGDGEGDGDVDFDAPVDTQKLKDFAEHRHHNMTTNNQNKTITNFSLFSYSPSINKPFCGFKTSRNSHVHD